MSLVRNKNLTVILEIRYLQVHRAMYFYVYNFKLDNEWI